MIETLNHMIETFESHCQYDSTFESYWSGRLNMIEMLNHMIETFETYCQYDSTFESYWSIIRCGLLVGVVVVVVVVGVVVLYCQ